MHELDEALQRGLEDLAREIDLKRTVNIICEKTGEEWYAHLETRHGERIKKNLHLGPESCIKPFICCFSQHVSKTFLLLDKTAPGFKTFIEEDYGIASHGYVLLERITDHSFVRLAPLQ